VSVPGVRPGDRGSEQRAPPLREREGKEIMTDQQAETDLTVGVFYRTGRAGAQRLSDGGGPFGFDIAVALMVDELIREYDCDAVAETGCFAGDTT
jgi:hypothetical protein